VKNSAPSAILLFSLYSCAVYGAAPFEDPQGRFSLEAPTGWHAAAAGRDTVLIAAGEAYATIAVVDDPNFSIAAVARQAGRQWQGFAETGRGHRDVAQRPAAFVAYAGRNPKGRDANLEIVAVDDGPRTYLFFLSAPKPEFARARSAFDQIERSFRIRAAGARPSAEPSRGSGPYLGLGVVDGPHGVTVAQVDPAGAAARAGFRTGDVILSIDRQPATGAGRFVEYLSTLAPGRTISAQVARAATGGKLTLTATLDRRPATTVAPPGRGGGIAVTARSAGTCRAMAPADWILKPGHDGQNAELFNRDDSAHAAWIIRFINPAIREYGGGDMAGPPDIANLAAVQFTTRMAARYTSAPEQSPYFVKRNFEVGPSTGFVMYKIYPAPPGSYPGSYIMSSYYAWARSDRPDLLRVATSVLATIQCAPIVANNPNTFRPSSGTKSRENDELKGYNAQLGMQYANCGAEGVKWFSAATDWNPAGVEGAGYYGHDGHKCENGWPK
jgi:hypothetical protein